MTKANRKSAKLQLIYPGKTEEKKILRKKAAGKITPAVRKKNTLSDSFFSGDNFPVLQHLVPLLEGKVDLIYIDPPFGTGKDFHDIDNDTAYSDKLTDAAFLEFLRVRLILLRECLSPGGSICLHIDKKAGHYVKLIMDEVFGQRNFLNDITRVKCNPKNFARNAYGNYSDMILFYAKKRDRNIFNETGDMLTKKEEESFFRKIHPVHGRYTTNPLHAPGETANGDTGRKWKGLLPPKGRHWRYSRKELDRLDKAGLIEWSDSNNPRKIVFAKGHKGKKVQDVWEFKDKGLSFSDYPTQKNHELLKRIILHSTNPGSLVLDAFAGSGGTLLVAHQLGRHFIGIDASKKSQAVVRKTLKEGKVPCSFYKHIGG
ncbi:MAG: type II DNA modification methylase [Bacteroidetes bacterium]|nr:MAG: type II DNA modification methylase [Bacteroidota bacterium]